MGPLSALLAAALSTAAPASTPEAAASEPVATAPRAADGPRDPFAIPMRTAAVEATTPAPPKRAHVVVEAPIRNPFVGPRPAGTRTISADLKDPFSLPPGSRSAPLSPIRDLRDPFVPRPDGARPGACATSSGVPVQRPKGMPAKRCPSHDAPLLNPFSAA